MEPLLEKSKKAILTRLLQETYPFGEEDEGGGILSFIRRIWDLDEMPSADSRYKTAADDLYQHTVNNRDYSDEELFLDRLKLASGDEAFFLKFLESVVNPDIRKTKEEIIRYVAIINSLLGKTLIGLVLTDYDEDLPIYSVRQKIQTGNLPEDVRHNDIFFFVFGDRGAQRAFFPKKFPCFALSKDNWNDYQIQTLFELHYYPSSGVAPIHIGLIKIMREGEKNTINTIPGEFTNLDENYCSIGQGIEFYHSLQAALGANFKSVLYALKDCAFFPVILERFETNKIFETSLIRYDEQERLSRVAQHMLKGYDLTKLYKFDYTFQPKYSEESIKIPFYFDSESDLPHRIYALIGKNGTGKTQIISSLPLDLSRKNEPVFSPIFPLFSKIITVSYSIFDKFETPKKTADFNYVYCGLKESPNKILSEDALLERFYSSIDKIKKIDRTKKLKGILMNFLEVELINTFFGDDTSDALKNGYRDSTVFKKEEFSTHRHKLSSGQSIILYIVTEIVANIRFDSLLLYDEPETHLHPNAVSKLINTIYKLVEQFESYCIIATHSPLIIQEIPSRDVYIIERDGEIISAKKIATESFGENLTTLTEEVFGSRETSKQYKEIIKKLVDGGKTFEEIISILENDGVPLSLNATIYIKSLILNRNEESAAF